MNNEDKLNLKMIALKEKFYKREESLDDEVANLRVALTEVNQNLQLLQQEYDEYKRLHPEETDVPEESEAQDSQN